MTNLVELRSLPFAPLDRILHFDCPLSETSFLVVNCLGVRGADHIELLLAFAEFLELGEDTVIGVLALENDLLSFMDEET